MWVTLKQKNFYPGEHILSLNPIALRQKLQTILAFLSATELRVPPNEMEDKYFCSWIMFLTAYHFPPTEE